MKGIGFIQKADGHFCLTFETKFHSLDLNIEKQTDLNLISLPAQMKFVIFTLRIPEQNFSGLIVLYRNLFR